MAEFNSLTSKAQPAHSSWGSTLSGRRKREAVMGYLFIAPVLIGLIIFTAGPVLVSLGLSLFKWNVFTPPEFIGLDNFTRMFDDRETITSFFNTIKFVLMTVSGQIVIGLLLALSIHGLKKGILRDYFRVAFFIPLISGATISIVMGYLFHKELGAVNYYLNMIGIPSIPWLVKSNWSMITVVIVSVWQALGFNFLLYVGALQNIPRDILDAADVDGAEGFARLWNITLPLISPIILFSAVIGVMNNLQIFEIPYVMTRGGPGDATRTVVMVIQQAAFKNFEIGYGASLAVILFGMIMVVTLIQFRMSRSWVFYQ